MKDIGCARKILGMQITRDKSCLILFVSQEDHLKKTLRKYAMSDAKEVSTPLANHFKLSSDICPKTYRERADIAKVPYANEVGSLMYFMVCTRPDLAYATSVISRYISEPGKM